MDRSASTPSEPAAEIETDGSGTAHPSTDRARSRRGRIGGVDASRSWAARLRRRLGAIVSGTRFGQFLSVGVLGALFDNALLIGFHGFGGISLGSAKLASAEAAILFMFACNERWTFSGWGKNGLNGLARRVVTSNLVRLGGVAVATGVLLVLTKLGVWYVLANVVGIGVGALLNYVLESLLTWRVHRE